MLNDNFVLINVKSNKDIAIILDASESAGEYQETIVKIALQLIEKFPAGTIKGLYFLSNSNCYDPAKLSRNSAVWWEQNKLKGSFLTPVLEQLKESMAVIIGSGIIYDLEDWQDSRWQSNLCFYKVKDSLRGESKIGKEFEDVSHVLAFLYDPIMSVEITGTAFMPFFWNNPEYKLSFSGNVNLTCSNFKNPSVLIGYWGNEIKSLAIRKSGEEETLTSKAIDYWEEDDWNSLTVNEAEIYHKAIRGQEFDCIICGQKHSALRIRCDTNSILGEPVYPSLGKKRGFVLFKETADKVQFRFHPNNVIKLEDLSVAISLNGGEARIFELNQAENKWNNKMDFNNYYIRKDDRIIFI